MSLLRTSEDTKGQNIPTLTIYLFYISATLWGFTEQEEVTGLFSKDCILPCSFPPGNDVVIHWLKGDKSVHSYYHQKDQPADRSEYINRTQLFHENIPSGNASLKIYNLTVTDEGTYECYVGTTKSSTNQKVTLRVKVSSYYALEYQKTDTERKLKCYAFLTYPAPNISWQQGNIFIQETDREETRDGVLSSLRSDQNIINTTADPYYCHIHVHHLIWTAEWKMQGQLSNTEGSNTVIPCGYSSNTANIEGVCVVWKLNRNSVTSVVASFNGTFHSYQPRAQINTSDFSLILHDLTAIDSGEYLCNISTPHYTRLFVTTLQIENSGNTYNIVSGVVGVLIAVMMVAGCCLYIKCRPARTSSEKLDPPAEEPSGEEGALSPICSSVGNGVCPSTKAGNSQPQPATDSDPGENCSSPLPTKTAAHRSPTDCSSPLPKQTETTALSWTAVTTFDQTAPALSPTGFSPPLSL